MRRIVISVLLLIAVVNLQAQSTISFTFDDGVTNDMPGYSFEQWNARLLGHLENAKIKAVFFVTGSNKLDEKGQFLLRSWNEKGHRIGNHTFTHPNYNSKNTTVEMFCNELMKTDSVIRKFSNFIPLFRFPYFKEGDTREKVDRFRLFMKEHGYSNGYATIDASDWYVDSRLRIRLNGNPAADIEGFRKFYLEHLYERAVYYDEFGVKLTGRHVNHTILLHHNLAAALFLGDLIKMFNEKGWKVISAETAFKDLVFKSSPNILPAGESILWALAKESGKYDSVLRYPAEDSEYEKDKMDKLGL